jgi:hypothetical protein
LEATLVGWPPSRSATGGLWTVTFAEEGGKTRLTLLLTLEATHPEEQQREGWTAMLVRLGEHLAAA